MNLQPSQSPRTQRLSLGKLKQTSTQIITNVVEMWWDRISTASKINVMRLIECIAKKLELIGVSVYNQRERYSSRTARAISIL